MKKLDRIGSPRFAFSGWLVFLIGIFLTSLIIFPAADASTQEPQPPPACDSGAITIKPGAWVSTGVFLKKGQIAAITATGTMRYKEGQRIAFPPGGDMYGVWSLKAKVGSQIVDVSGRGEITANEDGELQLGAPARENKPVEEGLTYLDANYHYCATVKVVAVSSRTDSFTTIEKVQGEVSFRRISGNWAPVTIGMRLSDQDEIRTGIGSEVTLRFPGGASLHLREMAQVAIAQVLTVAGRFQIRFFLRLGEAAAKVPPRGAVQGDFTIQTPTATASVRGTIFTVRYHDKTATTTISVEEGEVLATPANSSLPPFTIRAGQRVEVTRNRVGPIQPSVETLRSGGSPAGGNSLTGIWLFRGIAGQNCTIESVGQNRFKFVTEKGAVGYGHFENPMTVVVDFPFEKGLVGVIVEGGNRIEWKNGEVWTRSTSKGPSSRGGNITAEQGVDRPGGDYRSFDLPKANPELCRSSCAEDLNCKAYTYVKPGIQAAAARCWLKSSVPAATPSGCCVSGIKQ
ncbi:MAG: PAN domain-containing protein [bacterium]